MSNIFNRPHHIQGLFNNKNGCTARELDLLSYIARLEGDRGLLWIALESVEQHSMGLPCWIARSIIEDLKKEYE